MDAKVCEARLVHQLLPDPAGAGRLEEALHPDVAGAASHLAAGQETRCTLSSAIKQDSHLKDRELYNQCGALAKISALSVSLFVMFFGISFDVLVAFSDVSFDVLDVLFNFFLNFISFDDYCRLPVSFDVFDVLFDVLFNVFDLP